MSHHMDIELSDDADATLTVLSATTGRTKSTLASAGVTALAVLLAQSDEDGHVWVADPNPRFLDRLLGRTRGIQLHIHIRKAPQ